MWGWDTPAKCGAHCNDTQISREFMNIAATLKGGPPYQPGVADLVRKRTTAQDDDPNVHCMPRGAPRIWTDDYYKRIVQVPGRVIILTERNMQYRQIFTDGRPLPDDQHPTWNGYSTAKWDGDNLAIDQKGEFQGNEIDIHETWTLSPDGKVLTISRKINSAQGELEMKLVADKQ